MRSPRDYKMSKELKNFFLSQIEEHELIIKKTKLSLQENFLRVVEICFKAIKKKIKLFSLAMEEALLMHSTFQPN